MGNSAEKKDMSARERILMSAFDLFHEKGIHATSVDDILEKSQAGKSQFYHYFKSKEGIIHEMLQGAYQMIKSGQTHFREINDWDDFKDWLDESIKKQQEHGCARACPIGQISAQLGDDDELLRQDIKLVFEAMKEFPKAFFIQLKARGELGDEVDPDALAEMCIAAMQGGAMLAKTNRDISSVRNIADHLYAYVRSLAK